MHYSVFIIVKQSSVCSTQGSNPLCCSRSIISAAQELPDLLPSELEPCLPHEYWFSKMGQYSGGYRDVYQAGKRPRATSWVWNVLAKSQPPQLYHMGPDRTGVTSISTLIPTQILRGREEDAQLELEHTEGSHGNNTNYIPGTRRLTVTWLKNTFMCRCRSSTEASWITADCQFAAWF